MFSAELNFLWYVLGAVGLFYVGMPIVLLFQQRFPARPDLLPLSFATLDRQVARFLTSQSDAVLELGFTEPILLRIPNAAPNVISYLVMLINRDSGDRAMVTFIVGQGQKAIQTSYVEYSTRFESGRVFNTLNSATIPAFPPAPQATRTQTPSVRDPEELYRLHRFVMDRHEADGPKVLYDADKALEYLAEYAFVKMYDTQVARGLLRYSSADDTYRLTFIGAYFLVWGLLPPLKWLRQWLLANREKAVLREFHRAGD